MITNMNLEKQKRFWEFIFMDDFEFYEKYIAELPREAQNRFFDETPGFFSDYICEPDEIDLENDRIYQNIMKQIKEIEKK